MQYTKWFISILLLALSSLAFSQDLEGEVFKRKIEDHNKRFEDFYIFKNAQKRRLVERQKGANEQRQYRLKIEKQHEEYRKEFVRNKKAKKIVSDEQWLEEIKKREQQHKVFRKKYVEYRNKLEKAEGRARKVPEDEEFGL